MISFIHDDGNFGERLVKAWALFFLSAFLCPDISYAHETGVFESSSSFTVAQAAFIQNLGNAKRSRSYDDDGFSEAYHNSFSCSSDASCPNNLPCVYNKCYDLCRETTCPYGQECHRGDCVPCRYNSGDCCPKGFFSNGRGKCVNPCNPNPCGGSHPSCRSDGVEDFTCSCTPNSCPQGQRCAGIACRPCPNGVCEPEVRR